MPPEMMTFGDGEVTTGGYAPDFIPNWLTKRRAVGDTVADAAGRLGFSKSFAKGFWKRLGVRR